MRRKKTIIKGTCIAVLSIAFLIGVCLASDYMNKYSVPAVVVGLDNEGNTLFETQDGNLWAYELPTYIGRGKEVRLNMYDMSPDGRTVEDNIILSITIDGTEVK